MRNVPLDPTYEHTLYFSPDQAGLLAQRNYFISKRKYALGAQSYQRVNKGVIRVGIEADNLYDCNYLMFQNYAFGEKWFYAFIKSVEYINNSVAEIEYEIDVMQTWLADYTLGMCYVEREHSAPNDTYPLYTNETLQGGDLIYEEKAKLDMNEMNLVVIATPKNDSQPHIYFNTFFYASVGSVFKLTAGNLPDIKSFIDQLVENNQQIIAMYQYPNILQGAEEGTTATRTISINKPTYLDTYANQYTPRNRKLLFYPYTRIRVSAHNGNYKDYAYERFDYFESAITCNFEVKCVNIPDVTVVAYPIDYNGESGFDSKMTIRDFPVCAWAIDSFTSWWAQNKWDIFYDGMSRILSSGARALNADIGIKNPVTRTNQREAGLLQSGVDFADYLLSTSISMAKATDSPNTVEGNTTTGNVNAGLGKQEICLYNVSIERERAIAIDDYFDRYGYACQRNKVPNRNVRPHWCYTKTIGCQITGSIPADDARTICNIYDKGITFWKDGDEVGNYSLNNTVSELPPQIP